MYEMKWEMQMEEIEAILEKIWDLHDKLSDAIHSISRTHFLNSTKTLRKSNNHKSSDDNGPGFVFVKDFPLEGDDSSVQEAKSLNAIRTALENLEDQLELFHVSFFFLGFPLYLFLWEFSENCEQRVFLSNSTSVALNSKS